MLRELLRVCKIVIYFLVIVLLELMLMEQERGSQLLRRLPRKI